MKSQNMVSLSIRKIIILTIFSNLSLNVVIVSLVRGNCINQALDILRLLPFPVFLGFVGINVLFSAN